MNPVTLLLQPPSYYQARHQSSSASAYLASHRDVGPATGYVAHHAVQAQAFLAQSIAQEYLQSGLTIEPYQTASAAYRRQVPPIPSVDISA